MKFWGLSFLRFTKLRYIYVGVGDFFGNYYLKYLFPLHTLSSVLHDMHVLSLRLCSVF